MPFQGLPDWTAISAAAGRLAQHAKQKCCMPQLLAVLTNCLNGVDADTNSINTNSRSGGWPDSGSRVEA